jgi:hypothetical protein
MKPLAPVLALLLLVSPTLFAAEDISGKWAGSLVITVEGDTSKDDTAYLVLKQAGTTVTGTAGPSATDQKIPIVEWQDRDNQEGWQGRHERDVCMGS